MRAHFTATLVFLLLSAVISAAKPLNAQVSISGEHNIAELLAEADRNFDLDSRDVVFLLDEYRVFWYADDRQITSVHQLIWIGSDIGVDMFGDRRIPYDDDCQRFNVAALRTWRDGQWWESGTTAVVETLPHAVNDAFDYTNMREMMLLHEGIEIPCVLETSYTIEDAFPCRKGAGGTWIFAGEFPTVASRFMLGVPKAEKPVYFATKTVPDPVVLGDKNPELDVYDFVMKDIPAIGTPHTIDPAGYTPHVTWSTWKSWNELGTDLRREFDGALVLDPALRDSVGEIVDRTFTLDDRADEIAKFVSRTTRLVRYTADYWTWKPRTALRVYNSGYAHRLDRTILAAALFQEAGFMVFPFFRGIGFDNVNEGAPTVSRCEEISLWISGSDAVEAWYDPSESNVHNGLNPIFGRSIWIPGSGDDPAVTWNSEGTVSRYALKLHIGFEEDAGNWSGRGVFSAENLFNPFHLMEGMGSEAHDYMQKVISGLLENTEIESCNPLTFNRFNITYGFEFKIKADSSADGQRLDLVLGDPGGGIFDRLPGDIHLYNQQRTSPAKLPGQMEQQIEVTIDAKGFEIAHLPPNKELDNEIGEFSVNTVRKGDRATITRRLSLQQTRVDPGAWNQLRDLLLDEKDKKYRRVIAKKAGE